MLLPAPFLSRVGDACFRRCRLSDGGCVLVALSGGADSVALALALCELGFRVEAAHCNFHLRGPESDRDEAFVKTFCEERGLPLHLRHFDTEAEARRRGVSIEMAARDLRYAFFAGIREAVGAEAVAVAHHRDDNAETLLLNLIRGAGLRGLTGMAWRNGDVVRPLLDVSREEIEAALAAAGQTYVTDSTNSETIYRRNKIRHELLPLLRTLNPAISQTLVATAGRLAEAEALYDFAVGALRERIALPRRDGGLDIDIETLNAAPAPATLLHELLTPFGFTAAAAADVFSALDGRTGAVFESAESLAVLDRGWLRVARRPAEVSLTLPEEGGVALPDGSRLTLQRLPRHELPAIPHEKAVACLDAEALCGKLLLRRPEAGDRFTPFGMTGSKLVSDYLTDRKRSALDKLSSLVVCDAAGIVWLVDERPASRCAVTPATRHVLLLTHNFPATEQQ